jgi:alanyl-tRNA synthetase
MKSKELRKLFLDFFEKRGHKIVKPVSLVSEGDKTVLFNVAGMQQFKPYYTREKDPIKDNHIGLNEPLGSQKITNIQPCIRTIDIDEVGDKSHLTIFEMLGNFAFNKAYFKEEAIKLAYDFIKEGLKLNMDDIYVTVYKGDDNVLIDQESYDLWKKMGLKESQIGLGEKIDNFWGPVGDTGICGPCSEIYFKGIEIWTIVFNQYFKKEDGSLELLENVGVDGGAGFERQLMAVNFGDDFEGKSIYDTDVFFDQIQFLKNKSLNYIERSARIVSDHFKASVFLIANGVLPANVDRGYVLRRLIRRIVRHLKQLEIEDNIFEQMLVNLQNVCGDYYTEIMESKNILDVINKEVDKFNLTLEKGLKELNILFNNISDKKIDGCKAFYIYETFGFPIELIKEEAENKGFVVDENGFNDEFEKHKEISRAGLEGKFGGHNLSELDTNSESYIKRKRLHTATHLLLKALRDVLGEDVFQKGSDVNDERLRFDFTFGRKLTEEELLKIQAMVNEKIQEGLMVSFQEMKTEDALKSGYLGSFMLKYPEIVTVYNIGDWSKEICAGPHVNNTKELGEFKIIKEEASSQGVRRIKAIIK